MSGRTMRGGVMLALCAALAMSGCADKDQPGGGTAAGTTKTAEAPKDATAALVAAATKLQKDSFRATIAMGEEGTMTGVMDPAKKAGEFTMKGASDGTTFKTELRIVDGVNYMRITMPGSDLPGMDGKTWRKLDTGAGAGTLGGFDAADTVKTLESATDVKWAGDHAVTGTIDLAKAGSQLGVGAADVSKLSTKTVPFEASFDGEGRLVRYALTMPAVGSEAAMKMDMKYSDFGLPVTVEAPPASELTKS